MGWAVLSPTAGPPPGALAGEYVGASADVGLGLGAGVNVLMGGSGRSFALQPVSLQGSVAVNVTLGLPFVRTSVDHGTGFDIVEKGVADATSMVEAMKVAVDLAQER